MTLLSCGVVAEPESSSDSICRHFRLGSLKGRRESALGRRCFPRNTFPARRFHADAAGEMAKRERTSAKVTDYGHMKRNYADQHRRSFHGVGFKEISFDANDST